MSDLALRLCGDVVLMPAGGGSTGPPLGSKTLALLAFLLLEPRVHRREELAALLWGEYPEQKAKASLRQALRRLRDAVGDAVRVDRTSVELREPVSCDATEFLRLARVDPYAAIAIDIPRFMESLSVRRSAAFEEWAEERRAEFVGRYRELLARCAHEAMARREWREAANLAERWSELDRLADEPVAVLMEAQFLAGNRVAAMATYSQHLARLAADSGRNPGPAIAKLVRRIGQPAAVRRNGMMDAGKERAPSFDASLVGRESEWQALSRLWDTVAGGSSRIALIEGEPGAGKTRLADDFLRWVTARGGLVLRGSAPDAHAGAFCGSVMGMLRAAIDAPGLAGVDAQWLAEVARVVPELHTRFAGVREVREPVGAGDGRLFEAVAQVLLAISEESPVAVLIDDLQWCDAHSGSLLHFLVRRLGDAPILWCLTFTSGGVERDAPAARLTRALRETRTSTSFVLPPLQEEHIWRMIRELGRVDAPNGARRLAARVHEVAAGNPFYVIELLKTLFAQELLTVDPDSSAWVVSTPALTGAAVPPLAPTMHDAIAERIECLSDELHELLITLAVAERGCRTDALSHVHGISRLRAAIQGDSLVERQLVTEQDGVYRCAHPVIAHVVRQRLSASRRREVHRALALALELVRPPGESDDADGEIARHAAQAGEREIAYRHALSAIESCTQRGAWEEALTWLDLAARSAATDEESRIVDRVTAQVHEQAGWREPPPICPPVSLPIGPVRREDLDLPAPP
jgi:DNA-binding SARP family transcriptional activator